MLQWMQHLLRLVEISRLAPAPFDPVPAKHGEEQHVNRPKVESRFGKDGVYIRVTYIYAYCIASISCKLSSVACFFGAGSAAASGFCWLRKILFLFC